MLETILIVGCGNMGGAMLAGWLAGGLAPSRFTVVDPVLAEVPAGVTLLREVPQGAKFDLLLLGIKPQMLADLAPAIAPAAGPDTTVLSMLAGADLATLAARFPDAAGWVRIMPNLAAAIGKAPMGLAAQGVDGAARAELTALLAPLGTPEWLASEDLLDVVTALAGSGPAFVYRFIDALAAGAVAQGLDAAQAQRLALATVEGAALLAAASPHAPGELARRVASPGGTTQAGLDVLDDEGALACLIGETIAAATARGAELARAARG